MTINNAKELAKSLDFKKPSEVADYCLNLDYPVLIAEYMDFNYSARKGAGIALEVFVPDSTARLEKRIAYPFTDDDFDDAITGLQCWADYKNHEGRTESETI